MTSHLQRYTRNRMFSPGVEESYGLVLLDDNGIEVDRCDIGASSHTYYHTKFDGTVEEFFAQCKPQSEDDMEDFEF